MSGSVSGDMKAEPNLTPMLDMVFQLVTFFMLVINFKGAAMDLSLKLPVLGSARPLESKGEHEQIVLNIDAQGQLKVYGTPKDIKTYIAGEAHVAGLKVPNYKKGDELPTTIVVRADKGISFKLLNEIVQTCQNNGFRKFELKAMTRQEGP